jgi:hypothetical protein
MPVDKKSFKVIRKGVTSGRDSGSSEATSPRDGPSPTHGGKGERTFRVKRLGQLKPEVRPPPDVPPSTKTSPATIHSRLPTTDAPAVPSLSKTSGAGPSTTRSTPASPSVHTSPAPTPDRQPARSFKVLRPSVYSPPNVSSPPALGSASVPSSPNTSMASPALASTRPNGARRVSSGFVVNRPATITTATSGGRPLSPAPAPTGSGSSPTSPILGGAAAMGYANVPTSERRASAGLQ